VPKQLSGIAGHAAMLAAIVSIVLAHQMHAGA
jgi:hypothetical protein